ncbi:serine/threonine-protein kinase pakC-like [Dendronephthya gigantea]|uniref:serine/threonine-protein kinase pakC-like n=1 Tax=Dendronephthya gigantea TaxID=151771 RepID=UPI00106D07E9|nr:serine/threonine-protein kinase pakC-like [Dendronephthya gigantea]
MVKCLVGNGADVNGKNNSGLTVLHCAVVKGSLEMVEYLLEKGVDVNVKNTHLQTVLHSAISEGKPEMVKYLVGIGADVNAIKNSGLTVLHSAVRKGSLEMVEYLVENGADVNANDSNGETVVQSAVRVGDLVTVKYLVEQGADITVRNEYLFSVGIVILQMAVRNNFVALVNLLYEKDIAMWREQKIIVKGQGMNLLEWSIHLGHDEIATIFKSSVKHREKIQKLKITNCNQLEEVIGKFTNKRHRSSLTRIWFRAFGFAHGFTYNPNSFRKVLFSSEDGSMKDVMLFIGIPMQAFVAEKQFRIGDGGYSSVYVGLMKDGTEVAVKKMQVEKCDKVAENEREIMDLIKTSDSPFIVSYRHFHRDDTSMYLILDLCEETLKELVHASSIEHLQERGPRMIKEILSGLKFLHGKGILHRDLKPSNVLADIEGCMKLADFGLSRVLKEDETTVKTDANGTPGWVPTEVIEAVEKQEKGPFKKKSDVQVAGMIAFFILTKGEHPFGSQFDRMRNILKGNPVNLKKLGDRKARKFVAWLIHHKIDKRPFAEEALWDSFINKD